MDATRSDVDFLAEVLQTAIEAGATTINVPDTVGYALPTEYAALMDSLYEKVPGLENVVLSVHCHNDLGLAVANSLAAVERGATQVEVAVNGLGERAGNAALEEIAMALVTRADILQRPVQHRHHRDRPHQPHGVELHRAAWCRPTRPSWARMRSLTNRASTRTGVLKERTTYEIMHAKDIGLTESDIVLGKHSGRHALRSHLAELGIHLEGAELDEAFRRFKEIADKKKEVTTADLEALVGEEIREREDVYSLDHFYVSAGIGHHLLRARWACASRASRMPGKAFSGGSVESIFLAIDDAVGVSGKLMDYQVRSITSGKDSLGEVRVVVEVDGKRYAGQAVSIDVLEASAKAYVRALNNVAMGREAGGARGDRVYL